MKRPCACCAHYRRDTIRSVSRDATSRIHELRHPLWRSCNTAHTRCTQQKCASTPGVYTSANARLAQLPASIRPMSLCVVISARGGLALRQRIAQIFSLQRRTVRRSSRVEPHRPAPTPPFFNRGRVHQSLPGGERSDLGGSCHMRCRSGRKCWRRS